MLVLCVQVVCTKLSGSVALYFRFKKVSELEGFYVGLGASQGSFSLVACILEVGLLENRDRALVLVRLNVRRVEGHAVFIGAF